MSCKEIGCHTQESQMAMLNTYVYVPAVRLTEEFDLEEMIGFPAGDLANFRTASAVFWFRVS